MLGENLTALLLSGLASLQSHAADWFLDKTVGWPKQPPVNKIDMHHHFVPDFFAKAIDEYGGGSIDGWPTPSWSPVSSRLIMKHLGVQTAILSATVPGPCIVPDPDGQAAMARRLNEYAAALRGEDPLTFGFFASLPDARNASAAVAELRYALDYLRADGVVLFTRYGPGNTYLGHADLDPVWHELNVRNATVFVHPTQAAGGEDIVLWNERVPSPVIDYPHETTRTALDMIVSRTLVRFPNVKVVLSHAGGNLPWLLSRLTTTLRRLPNAAASHKLGTTYEEARQALKTFYYDVALSTAPHVLRTLLELVPHDHIVYGSDFPYVPTPAQPAFLEDLEAFDMAQGIRDMLNFGNAQHLLPRLAKQVGLPEIPEEEQCAVPEL